MKRVINQPTDFICRKNREHFVEAFGGEVIVRKYLLSGAPAEIGRVADGGGQFFVTDSEGEVVSIDPQGLDVEVTCNPTE